MTAAESFALAPAHVHLNLLGWVTIAFYGLCYRAVPEAATGLLPRVQFWLGTAGVAVMIPAVAWRVLEHPEAELVIGPNALMVIAAMAVFGVAVVVCGRPAPAIAKARAHLEQLRSAAAPDAEVQGDRSRRSMPPSR